MNTKDFEKWNLNELSSIEIDKINGGESAWYWVAYGIGAVGRGVAYVWNKCGDPEMAAQMM